LTGARGLVNWPEGGAGEQGLKGDDPGRSIVELLQANASMTKPDFAEMPGVAKATSRGSLHPKWLQRETP
jgi:hypothetical protein